MQEEHQVQIPEICHPGVFQKEQGDQEGEQ
jgi:hypothetical protein